MSITNFSDKYINDSLSIIDFELDGEGSVEWESPSNIALIKYWGKYGDQLPQNPSISFTLKNSKTITRITYQSKKVDKAKIEYYFENSRNIDFENRIVKYFDKISKFIPFINKLDLNIYSSNTFPHSAGIASSASSFSSLALCLCSIENNLFNTLNNNDDFYRKASFLARLGSGSACRSTFGKLALWGETESLEGSSNELAIRVDDYIDEVYKSYFDSILIIDSAKKSLSSSLGHGLMQNHPFANARYEQARENLKKLIVAMKHGDQKSFSEIVENEAMTLHGLMLSSTPFYSLFKPNTLSVISKLINFRKEQGIDFTFTLDAGPNIHILYPKKVREKMVDYINSDLKAHCENGLWIDDEVSDGPTLLSI